MKNTLINETCAAMTSSYHEAFWKAMRGNNLAFGEMAQARISDNGGTYLFPAKVASRYSAALKNTNLFRQISTVMAGLAGDAIFWMGDMDDKPQWVPENAGIPAGNDTLGPKKHVNFHKLAVITSLELDYVSEAAFDLEGYLVGKFAKCFGKAEEDAFINGSGNSMRKESCMIPMGLKPASPSPAISPSMTCWACTSPWISAIAAMACGS